MIKLMLAVLAVIYTACLCTNGYSASPKNLSKIAPAVVIGSLFTVTKSDAANEQSIETSLQGSEEQSPVAGMEFVLVKEPEKVQNLAIDACIKPTSPLRFEYEKLKLIQGELIARRGRVERLTESLLKEKDTLLELKNRVDEAIRVESAYQQDYQQTQFRYNDATSIANSTCWWCSSLLGSFSYTLLNDLVAASLNNPQQKALQWSEVKVLLRQAQQDYDDAKDNERQLSREVREARYTYEDILIRYKLQHEIYTNALNQLVRNPLKSLLQEKTVRKGVTDSNGKIYFDNLQPGFYGILLRDGDGTERFMRNQLVSGVNKFNQNIQEIPLFVNTCGTMEDPSVLALAPMPENTPVKTTNKVDSEKQTGVAKVVLYRNNPDYTSLRSYHFFIDGKDVGKVKVGEQLSFDLPPGPHVFYIKIGYAKSEMLNFNLNPGQILRLRCYASTWAYKLVVDSNF